MAATYTTTLVLILYVLTVARLTRIITLDKVGEPIRDWATARWGADAMRTFLFWCPFCLGFWIAGALAFPAALIAGVPWWLGFGLWPAASQLAGMLNRES
ncbi:hypothetical protein [Nocardia carnea]|uniref:hypothetical protein n=1 Tax=Nocardia carnea TaxID=37328 RepID=UPI002457DFB2|nr:hypothetical protein [Nocardia carnea]